MCCIRRILLFLHEVKKLMSPLMEFASLKFDNHVCHSTNDKNLSLFKYNDILSFI